MRKEEDIGKSRASRAEGKGTRKVSKNGCRRKERGGEEEDEERQKGQGSRGICELGGPSLVGVSWSTVTQRMLWKP